MILEDIRKVVEDELAKARKQAADCEAGGDRNPDDPEWNTMAECYRESATAIERILAALPPATEKAA